MTKVLIIEDEELVRENLLELLDAEGFDVITAENGLVGSRLAQEQIPDLILCDVMMPEMDGYAVLEWLRQNPETATVPFIFLTAKAAKSDFRQGMELGADDYLTKPFTRAELLGAINSRLKKKALIQAHHHHQISQLEEKLKYVLYHDRLTDLPNRLSLRENFTRIVGNISTTSRNNHLLIVMCLAVDRFSRINETLGHSSGDSLQKIAAQRLLDCVNSDDLVAYLSTNRFAILLTSDRYESKEFYASEFARQILDRFSKSCTINNQEVFVTASIGISFYPQNSIELESLLGQANLAMDYAASQGGNQFQFYTPAFNIQSSDRLVLETDLRYALAREELIVYYQPRLSLKTGEIVGAEALVRWLHPKRGLISPSKFIPIAEESGEIFPIGEWVWRTACRQVASWNLIRAEPCQIAVNLSARQFGQIDLPNHLEDILLETGLNPRYLELELTESILVQNPLLAKQKMEAIKALGVQLAIDDFGTGYASLSYLQQFPFDILKIDRCFVHNLSDEAKNAAIAIAIVQMAHKLNFKVIAEGVETQAELDFLREHDCDEIQGYFLSHPLSAERFFRLFITEKSSNFYFD
ncbi:MAG: EAL domain-containing protein [Oscillatoria sp. PMC 1051.18]|nr:EAL domain-containing protein [Oscillatoria sp. PMC 1050.18]MEC5033030.1 EAL domain-containing protein [Oscillatoria sp. PMC 1051.18]